MNVGDIFLFHSAEFVERREAILSNVEAKLGESDSRVLPRAYGELGRTAQAHNGLRFGKVLLQDQIKHNHQLFDRATHHYTLINSSPFGLHPLMFTPMLKLQATPEQLAHWLPLAESGKIIGCYCQTELGHGTFLRGLETRATFDHTTDEFEIHSPTVTSTKYWPGGLGYSSSHAIVIARLIIRGQDYGVHPFITQLRSLDDFKPMPGIELGDIGLKMGLNVADNGYAVFNRVRIPRENMLMRNARVSRDGTYIKSSNDKLTYGAMVYSRNAIVNVVAFQLAQAATIAIRYSVVREQGNLSFNPSNVRETPIIAFKSQQHRLLTIMSRAFGILFASKTCEAVYQDLISRQAQNDHSTLAHAHITTAGMKAYATQVAADGAEDARKCCGGHGYSLLSGLPDIVADLTSTATLEGENYVMYQQTARYLVKRASEIRKGQPVDRPMTYLVQEYKNSSLGKARLCTAQGKEFLQPEVQTSIFRHRAARLVFECEALLEDSQKRHHLTPEEAWNTHMMSLVIAARAHIEYLVLESFINEIARIGDSAARLVLRDLCDLFALSTVESPLSIGSIGFFEDSYISPTQLREIRFHVHDLLQALAPQAVALTDAWNFSDASLQSALGRKDGNVYETMLSWTRQIPLNQESRRSGGVDRVGFDRYVRPILQQAKL